MVILDSAAQVDTKSSLLLAHYSVLIGCHFGDRHSSLKMVRMRPPIAKNRFLPRIGFGGSQSGAIMRAELTT